MTDYLASTPDLADFVRHLSRHGVKYLVVGGHAVGFHAKPRATKDLDVWLGPGQDNRRRAVEAMTEYGVPQTIVDALVKARENEIVWFGRPPYRIDILQSLPGVDFATAWPRAAHANSGGDDITIVGLEDLIRNKEAVGRDQDRVDVKLLRRQLER